MEQLRFEDCCPVVRSDAIFAFVRPLIDKLLPLFNLSPRHVSIAPLKPKGSSLSYSISPSIFAAQDAKSNKTRGAVVCRIIDQTKVTYIEFPADRAAFYSSIGTTTKVGATPQYLRINLPANPNLSVIADAICADIDAFLRAFPSDIACCGQYQKCSEIGHCIQANQDLAIGCYYKKNLMAGRNFYSSSEGEARND